MRIVLTGSSGRIGRAIHRRLSAHHDVVGVDSIPASATSVVGDVVDRTLLTRLCAGADAIVHVAALHAPHVGLVADEDFVRVNVEGTRAVIDAALAARVPRIVYTSTTALYGHAIAPGRCTWVDEETVPQPRTIYHRTKLEAEALLRNTSTDTGLEVRVLRVSRCFPEPAPLMAVYRLHRGIDARDVADAHYSALVNAGDPYQCYIVSAAAPFHRDDVATLAEDAPHVIHHREPALADAFVDRGWTLPGSIDRVYDATRAILDLGWSPRFGFEEVLAELDRESPEVLVAAGHPANGGQRAAGHSREDF